MHRLKGTVANGYSAIVLTLDTYSHVLPHMQKSASARLENLLYNKEDDKGCRIKSRVLHVNTVVELFGGAGQSCQSANKSHPSTLKASGHQPNARINPRRAIATTHDVRKHHESDAIEASG